MNSAINKLLFAIDKFIPEINQETGIYVQWFWNIQRNKKPKKNKNTKIQKTRRPYNSIEMNQKSPKFNIIWYIHILKISQEETNLTKYYVIRHLASKPKYDVYQREFASKVYKFLDKKAGETGKGISENQELASQLSESISRKFKKSHTHLIDITFGMLILQTCSLLAN